MLIGNIRIANRATFQYHCFAPIIVPIGSLEKLEDVARFYFNKRRKTMGHNTNRMAKAAPELRPILDEWIAEGRWDMNMRTQEVSTEQFCALARRLDQEQIKIPLT